MLAARQSHNQEESIPTRKGIGPKTVRGPLHIQCDGSGDGGRFRELIAEVLSWPNVEMYSITCKLSRLYLYPFKTRSGCKRFGRGCRCKEFCAGLYGGAYHCFDLAFGNRPSGYRLRVG
jgi:hypothetical protein